MEQASVGIIGGAIGGILGLIGGIAGTYMSIKNTKTPAEKKLMIKLSVITWLLFIIVLAVPLTLSLMGIIPRWVPFVGLGMIWIIMTPLIIIGNKKLMELRQSKDVG